MHTFSRFLYICFATCLVFCSFCIYLPAAPYKIGVCGDSLVAGLPMGYEYSWCNLLEIDLNESEYPCKITSCPISDSTSFSSVKCVKWLIENDKPDVIILAFGVNDCLRNYSQDQVMDNLQDSINIAHENKIKVFLGNVDISKLKGWSVNKSKAEEFRFIYVLLGIKNPDITVFKYFDESIFLNPKLTTEDGLHPNLEGQNVIKNRVRKALSNSFS